MSDAFAPLDMAKEMNRMNIPSDKWRISEVNHNYEICHSYPAQWIVPSAVNDEMLIQSAKFRSKGRLPVLTWYNPRKGNAIIRCAQPNVGLTGNTSKEDQSLIEQIRLRNSKPLDLMIFDARSKLAAEVEQPFFLPLSLFILNDIILFRATKFGAMEPRMWNRCT